jgi:cytochrome b involved in lipid metabolism
VSPFRGFLQERALQPEGGPVWLLLSARTSRDVCYRDELAALAADGRLQVRVALTRQGDAEGLDGLSGRPGGVDDLVLDESDGPVLWQLLRDGSAAGPSARVYVCGNAGFAASVAEAVRTLVRRHAETAPHPDPGVALVRRLFAEGRYVEELYTTHLDPERAPQRVLDVSELVLHNAGPGGTWTAIGGRVYDISEFVHEHPGGTALLQGYAGMDATHAFEQVGHHSRPDVAAHLPRYEVGALRRLQLGREWGVALTASGLRTVDLDEAHAAWVDLLYLAVEMQNAFRTDRTLPQRPTSRGSAALPDLYSLQFAVETHARFLAECLPALTGDALSELWALTVGVCAPDEDVRHLPRLLEAVRMSACAEEALNSPTVLLHHLEGLVDGKDAAAVDRLAALCRRLHARDAQLLDDVKLALRGGVRVFEELQPDVVRRGATRLVAAALETVGLLQGYCTDVAAELRPASA